MLKNNILLNEIIIDGSSFHLKETKPYFNKDASAYFLSINKDGISWQPPIEFPNFYFKDERIGIGRFPLFNYKFDIKVLPNTLTSAFHIGDGKYGFSMGNGTSNGFIPEIIGLGANENDAGLYLLGKSTTKKSSNIPLVIIGGISPKRNRPLLGITNGKYDQYEVLINSNGTIEATDFKTSKSSFSDILEIVKDQQTTINTLMERIKKLEKSFK